MSRANDNWFHGKISREQAEELIKSHEDGTFLVRDSSTAPGDFVLTLIYQGEVCHYQIRRHGEDAFFSIDDKVKILHGLDTLVEFYQQAANGLVTKLINHLPKDPPPNDSRSHGVTNLLHRATKENNECVVSELLKCGYRNVDAKNQDGQTAVHLAALHCDEPILRMLLKAGVNVNCMDSFGNMPLHYACRSKPASFIRILLEANANVQLRNRQNDYVPLHEAAKYGNLEAVKELLLCNAPLLPRTSCGEFPIDLAKEAGQEHVVAFLNTYKPAAATTHKQQWYHGTLKREEAVQTLLAYAANMEKSSQPPVEGGAEASEGAAAKKVDTSGCFLVRYSERTGYVLTLLWNNMVNNYIISQSSKYLYIDQGPYLPSLEHLVEHFQRFSDGLPVPLKYPVEPKPKPPLPLFSTMPRSLHKKTSESSLSPTTPAADDADPQSRKYSLDSHQMSAVSPPAKPPVHSHTLNPKKKPKEHQSNSVFNTFRLRSPKKSILIDGMNSLRKSKGKSKRASDSERSPSKPNDVEELQQAQQLFQNLKFSADFAAKPASVVADKPSEEFYNVPKNNAAVVDEPPTTGSQQPLGLESKTDEEVEYFTKSDVTIALERMNAGEPRGGDGISNNNNVPTPLTLNPNGYIPTVDIRVFNDTCNNPDFNRQESAAELREFSQHPERLDSIISTTSTDSSLMRLLNRQGSSVSQTSVSTPPPVEGVKLSYLIPRENLELEAIIGEGEFASVYRGTLKVRRPGSAPGDVGAFDKVSVAIKTLKNEHCRSTKQEFLREASVMIRLQHHCIVQLIGISRGDALMMVQELVPLGSMINFILDHKAFINPNCELKLWASQIACGMQFLESHHFVHRDLAARNILLASRNQIKISDFGLSRALGTDSDCYQASQGGKWPIKWYAPESFNNGLFSHASDVWSFGVTLWEMFSLGEPPYGDIRGVDAIALIESGQRLAKPDLCPPHVYEIMKNCWNYKPKDRPTFRYLTDFFVNDPDYQNLMELVKTEHIS